MAACLLAALDNDEQETDSERVRAFAGATFLAEGLLDLRAIREALTKKA